MLERWIELGFTPIEAAKEVAAIDNGLEYALECGAISESEYEALAIEIYDILNAFNEWFQRESGKKIAKRVKTAVKGRKANRVYRTIGDAYYEVCGTGMPVYGRVSAISKKQTKPTLVAVKANKVTASAIRSTRFSTIVTREKLFHLEGCNTYTQGTWIWVTGKNTKKHRDFLKSLKFRWSKKSQAWYLKDGVLNFAW